MDDSRTSQVISLSNVTYTWPGNDTPTIDIESLKVERGEHLFIKGPSGCGKSTLLSLLTGIQLPQSGDLYVLGQRYDVLKGKQRDQFRADNLGYIFQQFNLLPYLNVIENIVLPCQLSPARRQRVEGDLRTQALNLMSKLNLDLSFANKPVVELSIGQQQRVAAARALLGSPSLLIADEPTSALDFDTRSAFIDLLKKQAEEQDTTVVFVSHDPTLEPMFHQSLDLPRLNRARSAL